MTITMDSAGRFVIPKAVREAAGLHPGVPLEVVYRDGRIEITPRPAEIEIVKRRGVLVALAKNEVPSMGTADVEAVQQTLRDER